MERYEYRNRESEKVRTKIVGWKRTTRLAGQIKKGLEYEAKNRIERYKCRNRIIRKVRPENSGLEKEG